MGSVSAAGESHTMLNYDLVDHDPYPGISYYRLSAYDRDGTRSAVEVRAVRVDPVEGRLVLMPDADGEGLWVAIPGGTTGSVTVFDMTGRAIHTKRYPSDPHRILVRLPIASLKPSAYLIGAGPTGAEFAARFIVRH